MFNARASSSAVASAADQRSAPENTPEYAAQLWLEDFNSIIHECLFNVDRGIEIPDSTNLTSYFSKPNLTLFESQLPLLELAQAVANAQYSEIKRLLDIASHDINVLTKFLKTKVTVINLLGRKFVKQTIFQIALGDREYDVVIQKNNQGIKIVDGIAELIRSYFDKLENGWVLAQAQFNEKFPNLAAEEKAVAEEEKENANAPFDPMVSKKLFAAVAEASSEIKQLIGKYEYVFAYAGWLSKDSEVPNRTIYLKAESEGLSFRYIGLDEKAKNTVMTWDNLKNVPHSLDEINDSLMLNNMFSAVAKATNEQIQQLMALDSFHGYDLRDFYSHYNDSDILASAIYLEVKQEGLRCRFRGLDGEVKNTLISWNNFKTVPRTVNEITNPSYTLCPLSKNIASLERGKLYISYHPRTQKFYYATLNADDVGIGDTIELSDLKKHLNDEQITLLLKTLQANRLSELQPFSDVILAITSRRNHTLSRSTYLPMILDQVAAAVNKVDQPQQFYTQEQIAELRILSHAVEIAGSKKIFADAFQALRQYIFKITQNEIPDALLKNLYQGRNYFEPRGKLYTTGYHCNEKLFPEACELYDGHYVAFGNNWSAPKNVFCWQKLVGLMQLCSLTPGDLQLAAQGFWPTIIDGNKSKRSFSFTYDGGAVLPLGSLDGFRLGYNFADVAGGGGQAGPPLRRVGCRFFYLEILCRAKTTASHDLRSGLQAADRCHQRRIATA